MWQSDREFTYLLPVSPLTKEINKSPQKYTPCESYQNLVAKLGNIDSSFQFDDTQFYEKIWSKSISQSEICIVISFLRFSEETIFA